MGEQIVIGSAMIAITVVIHTVGLIGLIPILRASAAVLAEFHELGRLILLLIAVIIGIFLIHSLEIWLWAAVLVWLGEFDNFQRALYFSTTTYTTLGYGDITLQVRWQLLAGLEAVNGVLLFGVSTAFIFATIRQLFAKALITAAPKK